MDPKTFAQLMNQYRQMQANPFARTIPGTEYLGGMGQGIMGGMGGQGMMGGEDMIPPPSPVPSDFSNTPPGLPNLPQDMQGFGFGQTAPQISTNRGLREKLIKELLEQLQGSMQPMTGMGGMGF